MNFEKIILSLTYTFLLFIFGFVAGAYVRDCYYKAKLVEWQCGYFDEDGVFHINQKMFYFDLHDYSELNFKEGKDLGDM